MSEPQPRDSRPYIDHPNDTACQHGYLYPSVGGQTPCPHPGCGSDDENPAAQDGAQQ